MSIHSKTQNPKRIKGTLDDAPHKSSPLEHQSFFVTSYMALCDSTDCVEKTVTKVLAKRSVKSLLFENVLFFVIKEWFSIAYPGERGREKEVLTKKGNRYDFFWLWASDLAVQMVADWLAGSWLDLDLNWNAVKMSSFVFVLEFQKAILVCQRINIIYHMTKHNFTL